MTIANAIALLGGLGFFLFGMSLLGEGLKRVAGGKLETILGKLTSTTFRGVLLGTLVTAVIQSSSATTVMVVGFVNSGIMKLANAIGIIMGANIGTTATGWILILAGVEGNGGISSATIFAFVSFIGIILYFFCKKSTYKNVGMILLAFSVLMSGMQSMSGAMAPLKTSPFFIDFMSAVSNPFVSLLVGVVVTAIIQSCSASIGILQALSITGIISYEVAIPMVVGMCIGACVPILISAMGANANGKRAAFIYLYFNFFGGILLLIPFYIIHAFVNFGIMSVTATSFGIAVVNTVFNVAATIVLAPFTKLVEKIAVKTIREKTGKSKKTDDSLLDKRFLDYPSLALEQSRKTIDMMSLTAFKNLIASVDLFYSYDEKQFAIIMEGEDKVDKYEDMLGAYLVQLNTRPLSEKENQASAKYLTCLGNIERISDHAVNLAELAKELQEKKISFSSQAAKELRVCTDAIHEILDLTGTALLNNDSETAKMVEPLEQVIDALTKELKVRHIQRVQTGTCTLELGFIYNDCVSNFERVADHCSNIAVAVIEAADTQLQSHNYLRGIKNADGEGYRKQLTGYATKYYTALDTSL